MHQTLPTVPGPLRAAAVAILVALAAPLWPAGPSAAAEAGRMSAGPDAASLCGREIARAERELSIPRRLLTAISQIESGRWNERARAVAAWPWTVMAEGRGRYLPTKAAAIAEVRGLLARGVRNIDVGCMQINLYHHPDAFDSLEQAFDPAANVAYGARFLRGLQIRQNSWVKAVGNYHSATPDRHRAYRAKVFEAWRKVRRSPTQAALEAAAQAPLPPGPPLSELGFSRAGPVSPGESS